MVYSQDETCGWPFDTDVYAPPDTGDPDMVTRAKNMTVNVLRMLTLYRVGGCPITVRPCTRACAPAGFYPNISVTGQWVNVCTCTTADTCGCSPVPSIDLPPPVGQIVSVSIDGAALDPSAYRLHNGYRLVRTDGQVWPVCQDMTAGMDEAGSFAVTYVNGYDPDDGAAVAASLLLKEFMKAMVDGDCTLSPRVRSVARRGISSEVREAVFQEGRTGIPLVDAWIMTWNPQLLRTRPNVWSPDLQRHQSTRPL